MTEIRRLLWDEVFELLFQLDQQRSVDLLWEVRTAGYAWASKQTQREILRDIRRLGERPNLRPSIYDNVDDETFVRMVGGAIAVRGQKWIDRHGRLMRMLSDIGVHPDEAVRRHRVWLAEQRKSFGGA